MVPMRKKQSPPKGVVSLEFQQMQVETSPKYEIICSPAKFANALSEQALSIYAFEFESLEELLSWLECLRKYSANFSNNRMFGVALDKLQKGKLFHSIIPSVIEKSISFLSSEKHLKQEGLFRISGLKSEVHQLKNEFDSGFKVDLSRYLDPNCIAGVLKLYLRELPQPLVDCEKLREFTPNLSCADSIRFISSSLQTLPDINLQILCYLSLFLNRVTQFSDFNLMNAENLSIVFAPNLFSQSKMPLSMGSGNNFKVMEYLIKEPHAIFHFFPNCQKFLQVQQSTSQFYVNDFLKNLQSFSFPPSSPTLVSQSEIQLNGHENQQTHSSQTTDQVGGSEATGKGVESLDNISRAKASVAPPIPKKVSHPIENPLVISANANANAPQSSQNQKQPSTLSSSPTLEGRKVDRSAKILPAFQMPPLSTEFNLMASRPLGPGKPRSQNRRPMAIRSKSCKIEMPSLSHSDFPEQQLLGSEVPLEDKRSIKHQMPKSHSDLSVPSRNDSPVMSAIPSPGFPVQESSNLGVSGVHSILNVPEKLTLQDLHTMLMNERRSREKLVARVMALEAIVGINSSQSGPVGFPTHVQPKFRPPSSKKP